MCASPLIFSSTADDLGDASPLEERHRNRMPECTRGGAQLEFTADRKPKPLRSLEIDERGQLCPIAIAGIVAASSALMNASYGGTVMAIKIYRIQPPALNLPI